MSEHIGEHIPDLSRIPPLNVVDGQESEHRCRCGAKSWYREVRTGVFRVEHNCLPPQPATEPTITPPRMVGRDDDDDL